MGFNRRHFMRGSIAAAALASAGAPSLLGVPTARADTSLAKLLVFASPNSWMVGWNGHGSGQGWGVDGLSELGTTTESVNLPDRLASIMQPLEEFGDRLLLLDGLRGLSLPPYSLGHASVNAHQHTAVMLTGRGVAADEPARAMGGDGEFYSRGISIDQELARRFGSEVLGLGYHIDGFQLGEGVISHLGADRPFLPFQNASDAWDAVYGVDTTDPAAVARNTRLQAILNTTEGDGRDMIARLPPLDRASVASHLDASASLRARLSNDGGLACAGTKPAFDYDPRAAQSVPRLMEDYADIMVAAMQCGRTRVGFIQPGNLGGGVRAQWPELGIDQAPSDHSWNHAFDGAFERADLAGFNQNDAYGFGIKLQQAYNTMFANILRRLSTTMDTDGRPMLDNTLCLHIKQMRTNHAAQRHMVLAAGGQALGVRGGRMIRFEGPNARPGAADEVRWINDLHVGIAQLMGETDLTSFGNPGMNTTPVDLT